jgi:glycosyltransferase involved in cell wall biosynthesis
MDRVPMKIAFYAPLKPLDHPVPSGDRKMARQLVAALRAGGHTVDIACDLRMHAATPHDAGRLDQARREADAIIARWQRQGGAGADLWFSYHPYYKAPDVVGPIICRHFGIAYVTAEASYAGKRDGDAWQASQALVIDAIGLARVNFCLTPGDAEGLARIAAADRLVMLAPFIETTGGGVKARRLHAPVRLVSVAMMRPGVKVQSYRFLAVALARLGAPDWHLTVVGDGPAMAEVRQAFAGLGPDRVGFSGELAPEAVKTLLGDSDIFVWPGFGEAYGLAYLEAQAAGLPAVALHTHGVPSVVCHGKTGLLVKDAAPDAFAAAIARIARDPALYGKFSRQARRFVAEERSLKAAAAILDRHLAPLTARQATA